MGPRTEQGGFRENPYETVGKVEVFPAQAGMSPPQCLNECPYEKGREIKTPRKRASFEPEPQ